MESSGSFEIFLGAEKHIVKLSEVKSETTLNEYLRKNRFLTGTKVMCKEGGCGACIVAATFKHPATKSIVTYAVNSCLVSIFSCSGWKISTIEGIGNIENPHPIQSNLAKFNGTQCGFCSSGMVMSMYSLYQNGNVTMNKIEEAFGGNMCRCTGYRPILAAFKSMAIDSTVENIGTVADIEDYPTCKLFESCKLENPDFGNCGSSCFSLQDSKWYKVLTIAEIMDILKAIPSSQTYKLVAGNTAKGVYKDMALADVYIDIAHVEELQTKVLNTNNFILGANMSLNDAINTFYEISSGNPNFSYLCKVADHIKLIAHVPVRNIGTIAGNLSIKHKHAEFPSDMFLLLDAIGAYLTIVDVNNKEIRLKVGDYLTYDMNKKMIKSIMLYPLGKNYYFESYKIMPRAQNAHAMVNAAFLLEMKNNTRVEAIRMVYGAINPKFSHASRTEAFLTGKNLFDNVVLQGAFNSLNNEIKPDHVLPDPTPIFRTKLAIALFYKFILSIAPNVSTAHKSGGTKLVRPLSYGTQDYDTQESLYPLTQAVPKLEAMAQTTGKAQYIDDMPDNPGQLFAAFVTARAPANSVFKGVDTSEALKIGGVIKYIDRSNIPGENTYTPPATDYECNEEIFCSGIVKFFFQPVGLIVATSQTIAEEAAALVKVNCERSSKKPLITIRDILKAKDTSRIQHKHTILPKRTGNNVKKVIKGTFDSFWQYHYHMETQCCNVIPIEDGFDIYPSTQWMDFAQTSGAQVLNLKKNQINVFVRRLGGAFGGKISRNNLISCAALIASNETKKPVNLIMSFTDNMNIIGKRNPVSADYEVSVDENGVIQSLKNTLYVDLGITSNEHPTEMVEKLFTATYSSDTFEIDVNETNSQNHASTWTRAPGSCEGLAMIETVMEHIAYEMKLDPVQVRLNNLNSEHPNLKRFFNELLTWADIPSRQKEIEEFNKANRWRKRGLSVVPMAYLCIFEGNYSVLVSVYKGDGSVAISHGGIEMGQGINTKAAQVVAYTLGIPLNLVKVKPSNSLVSPNSNTTGGSITSEAVCFGFQKACEELLERMKPYRKPADDWAKLVQECFRASVNLSAGYMWKTSDAKNYYIYGVVAAEIELDILSGNHIIQRVDLLEDTGESISPIIDIGQVEGAYIMGTGFWTSEEIVIDDKGELLTNRTWTYKPPGAKDIPVDFRVKFPEGNPNPLSPFKSKATAEPPLCMTFGIALALKQAIKSARLDSDPNANPWYPTYGPSTVEKNFMNCLHDYKQYTL